MTAGLFWQEEEKARICSAKRAFAPWLKKDAELWDAVNPIAHPMNQGVDGHSAKIAGANGENLFLKVLNKDQGRWGRFETTIKMTQMAANAELSPQLIASDVGAKAHLFECLGDGWRAAEVLDLRSQQARNDILAATKKLHGLKPLGRMVSMSDRIFELRQDMKMGAQHVVTGETIPVTPPEKYSEMCTVIDKIGLGFSASGSEVAPCHVENSLSNFMIGPSQSIKIVDFDRAADCDPLSDVGALCNEYCRTDNDVAEAVEIYLGRSDVASLARVKLHMILSAFQWGMWGKVSHFSSCRPEIEYYKFGENQFMRCAFHMCNWNVEQMIREM